MSYIKNSEFYACFKGTEMLKQVKHQMIDHGCYTTSRYPCQSPMSNVTCMQAYTGIWLGTSIAAGSYLHKGQKRRLIFVRPARSVETPPPNRSTSQGFPTPKLAMPVPAKAHLLLSGRFCSSVNFLSIHFQMTFLIWALLNMHRKEQDRGTARVWVDLHKYKYSICAHIQMM